MPLKHYCFNTNKKPWTSVCNPGGAFGVKVKFNSRVQCLHTGLMFDSTHKVHTIWSLLSSGEIPHEHVGGTVSVSDLTCLEIYIFGKKKKKKSLKLTYNSSYRFTPDTANELSKHHKLANLKCKCKILIQKGFSLKKWYGTLVTLKQLFSFLSFFQRFLKG